MIRLNTITQNGAYNAAKLLGENSFTTCGKTNKEKNEQINDPITLADTLAVWGMMAKLIHFAAVSNFNKTLLVKQNN